MPRFDRVEDCQIAYIDEQREQEREVATPRAPLAERLSPKSLLAVLDYCKLHHWEATWLSG